MFVCQKWKELLPAGKENPLQDFSSTWATLRFVHSVCWMRSPWLRATYTDPFGLGFSQERNAAMAAALLQRVSRTVIKANCDERALKWLWGSDEMVLWTHSRP